MASGAFVGRDRELAELERGLDALFAGRGALFLLSGEPGIGKTRLADRLCERAKERGAAIAWGAAWDGGGAPAYWPWTQVLRALRSRLPIPDERLRRELGPMWDSPAEEHAAASDLEVERFRRFDALRAVLQAAAHEPLVLVLDDLHAADRASLLALHFVARALRSLPILIVGTHRDAQEPELSELLAKIAREGRVLRLHPFNKGDVEQLMGKFDPVSPHLIEEVLRATGGNPLFIDETLRLVRSGERPSDLHANASAVIRDRIERLDHDLRELLEAAAVLGRELSIRFLGELLCADPDTVEAKLRAQQLSGIVARTGDTLRFCHALFREELYRGLASSQKRALHLRAGSLLTEPEELVARHLLAAQPDGDPAIAGECAVRAGEAAMRSLAFDRAAVFFEGAVAAFDRLPQDRPRRIDVRLRLAESLARAGYVDRGRAICLEAAAEARSLRDGARLANAALIYGAQLRIATVDRTLIELLEASLAMLGDAEPALRARVLARLAAAEQPASDPQVPVEKARRAIALARTVGDPDTLLATIYSAGSALVDFAPADERRVLAKELIALALPKGELALAQQGYARATMDSMDLCDFAGADAAIEGHERLGRALGHPRWLWRSAVLRSMRALVEGRWSASDAALEEAAAHAKQADDPNAGLTLASHSMGALRARESGRPSDLLSAWNLSIDSVEYGAVTGAAVRAAVLGRFGDPEPPRRFLSTFQLEPVHHDPMGLSLVADAITSAGDRGWAAQLLPALEPFRGRALSWGVLGMIWDGPVEQWIGALLSLEERWSEAVFELETALDRADALSARPIAARICDQLARASVKIGDHERARTLIDRAAAIASELGMVHLAARVEGTRAELARPMPKKTVAEPSPVPTLAREEDVWSISFRDRSIRLRHSRALEILDRLIQHPGKELHVLELGPTSEPVDAGDAGETIDAEAKAAYRTRIRELEEDLVQAEAWADAGRRDRVRAELEFLQEELSRSVGLGGRSRRAAGAVERARVNVTKRIKGVIKKIAEAHPQLGAHLETSVKTGVYVSYRPSHGP